MPFTTLSIETSELLDLILNWQYGYLWEEALSGQLPSAISNDETERAKAGFLLTLATDLLSSEALAKLNEEGTEDFAQDTQAASDTLMEAYVTKHSKALFDPAEVKLTQQAKIPGML